MADRGATCWLSPAELVVLLPSLGDGGHAVRPHRYRVTDAADVFRSVRSESAVREATGVTTAEALDGVHTRHGRALKKRWRPLVTSTAAGKNVFYLCRSVPWLRTLARSHAASGIRHPASGIRHPASGIRHPASGIRHPASGIWHPESLFVLAVILRGHRKERPMTTVFRFMNAVTVLAACVALGVAVERILADSSPKCDSNQQVVASGTGLAAPGGPDPTDPDHWEPIGDPGDGALPGWTCATVNCSSSCTTQTFEETLGSTPNRTNNSWQYCDCGTSEGVNGECKVRILRSYKETWNPDTQQLEWVLDQYKVVCSDQCSSGSCTFHVTTVGSNKIADCNCQ